MSRIGRQPIAVPGGVTATIEKGLFKVKGPKGELQVPHNPAIEISQSDGQLNVSRPSDRQDHRALHGLTRTLVANAIKGAANPDVARASANDNAIRELAKTIAKARAGAVAGKSGAVVGQRRREGN